jgi:ribose transport system permease protein
MSTQPAAPSVAATEDPETGGGTTAPAAESVGTGDRATGGIPWAAIVRGLRSHGVLVLFVVLFLVLTFTSDSFLTSRNLLNILNQNAPLAIVAAAGTFVIIAGGFDLSTGATFGVAAVCAAWIAANVDPVLGLVAAPFIGLALGTINGTLITQLKVHSFLATLASSLVFRGLAVLITDGRLIPVPDVDFQWLGREKLGDVNVAVLVFAAFALLLAWLLNRTVFGRHIYAVGGNEQAAELSGVPVSRTKILAFALSGLAAGIAGAITVSRIASGQPDAGSGVELEAIAAIILGGTSIYGGVGAVWRSVTGVYLLALIDNGFNVLDANPFYKDLTTGLIIVCAVALAAADNRDGRKR